jgi:uncharacterized membrane protein
MGLLFLVVLIIIAYLIFRSYDQGKIDLSKFGFSGKNESPQDILKKRLAEGKITEDEYNRIKKTMDS